MAVKKRKLKKKTVVKKIAKKKAIRKKPIKRKPAKRLRKPAKVKVSKKIKLDVIGVVTHYFPKVKAAVVKLKVPLAVGATVKIKGHTTDLTQNVTSMQIDRVPVQSAKKGEEIGVQVNSRVRQHDIVYKAK